jgi:acyl-CoA reductase-like NAD-dependent aldehyde dehydrogenase
MKRRAIGAADKARHEMASLTSYQRKEILEFCVGEFKDRFEELAMSLCIEAGKPIKVMQAASLVLASGTLMQVSYSVQLYGNSSPSLWKLSSAQSRWACHKLERYR